MSRSGVYSSGLWVVLVAIVLCCAFYLLQLIALVVRFGDLPNYVNVYPWIDNVKVIIESTPSRKDTLFILMDEWWIEIGYFNTDFGLGISEWSLYLAPAKILMVLFFCSLIALNLHSARKQKRLCNRNQYGAQVTSGIGALCLAMTSVTMSWVVCCATPSWIVGLAMLGLGVTVSLKLETIGPWVTATGLLLVVSITLIRLIQLKRSQSELA